MKSLEFSDIVPRHEETRQRVGRDSTMLAMRDGAEDTLVARRPHGERSLAPHLRRGGMEKAVEGPRKPCDVERNQALARRRIHELHRIFTSSHTEEAETLRHKLQLIEAEYAELQRKLLQVEENYRNLQRRLANEKENNYSKESFSQQLSERSEATSSSVEEHNVSATRSETEQEQEEKAQQSQEESLRLQLEQTLRDQDEVVTEIRKDVKEYDVERQARDKWAEGLEEGYKDAELRKMRYRVRLQKASDRSKMLMKQLRDSYIRMSELVQERIQTEGEGAKNDAFLKYSEMIHHLSLERLTATLEDREPLKRLLSKNRQREEMEEKAQRLRARLEEEAQAAELITQECKQLVSGLEVLQQAWTTLPAELKHTLSGLKAEQERFQGRWPHHPVNGIKRMRDCITSVDTKTNTISHDTKQQLLKLEPCRK